MDDARVVRFTHYLLREGRFQDESSAQREAARLIAAADERWRVRGTTSSDREAG